MLFQQPFDLPPASPASACLPALSDSAQPRKPENYEWYKISPNPWWLRSRRRTAKCSGFGIVILVGQAFWLASRRVTQRMEMDRKVQMGTLLGSKSTWTTQDFFASKNWHEKPLFWQSAGNTIGTEGMPSITEHSLEDGREGDC